MTTDNIIIVDSKTSIHDVVEEINCLIANGSENLIAEIHSPLKCVVKAISIVEIVKRVNTGVNVEIKNSNFLNGECNGSKRRGIATVIIKLERSGNCVHVTK